MLAGWFKHVQAVESDFLPVINTGNWFRCIMSAIFHLQQSLPALFSQTTSHFVSMNWIKNCFSFLHVLPYCLRAGDLSWVNHHVTSPHISAYLDGKGELSFLTACWKIKQHVQDCFTHFSSSTTFFALFLHSFTPTRSLCRAKAGVAFAGVYSFKSNEERKRGQLTFKWIQKTSF